MSNVVALHAKPSLCALRKAGALILREFAGDENRRRILFNEVVRIAFDEPTPPDRNPEVRGLVTLLARSFEQQCE